MPKDWTLEAARAASTGRPSIATAVGCSSLLLLLAAHAAHAGDVVPEQEYSKYIDKHRSVQAMDSSLFGEQVNLRDGGVQFVVVDGELDGNGPPIRIVRSFRIRENDRFVETSGNRLGDWELEIPRLKTITNDTTGTDPDSSIGWEVDGLDKDARCSEFGPPSDTVFADPGKYWEPYEWWSGYQLVDGSGNEQEMLQVVSGYPEVAGYKAVTNGNWRFSCLSTTANGEPGEGFLGTAPDGTRYWFDYLVYTTADTMTKPYGQMASSARSKGQSVLLSPVLTLMQRRHAALLVTRIEDRFGNWLTYQYNSTGHLTRIDASDGRVLTVGGTTSPTISLGAGADKQTWTYGASSVTLPDGSAWTYDFDDLTTAPQDITVFDSGGNCGLVGITETGSTIQGTATSPSGVTGTFTFTNRLFGRSYATKSCIDPDGDGRGYATHPGEWHAYALAQRSFSGPGVPVRTWAYTYSPPNSSWSDDCTSGCTTEVWTDVTAPDGVRQRNVFSNRENETENLLLREETYTSTGTLMRKVEHSYATYTASSPYAWPEFVGYDLQIRTNHKRSERWTQAKKHETTLQGRKFTWEVPSTCGSGSALCFDQFARPTKAVKSNAPTSGSADYSRSETTVYHDNTTIWVLGQTASVTCTAATPSSNACDGDVVSATTYDSTYAMPLTTSAFGKLQQTFTYDTTSTVASLTGQRGTLATVKDGNNNITTYSSWNRGIPQTVHFPATPEATSGATRSAVVNEQGWITSVTDENGYATTYHYDDMGRVDQVTPPTGDSTTWAATSSTFERMTTAENGLAAGHWRETISTGAARKVTLFDAFWRPVLVREYDNGDPTGSSRYVATAYDAGGRVADVSYPTSAAPTQISDGTWQVSGVRPAGVRTSYDALGRPTTVRQDSELGVLTTTTDYLTDFKRRVTDARAHATTEQFMAWDAPSFDWPVLIDAPEGQRTSIARDAFGKPTQITRGATP